MRTIKFRGKNIETGKWVYGYQAEMAFAIQQGKTIEFENGDC